MDATLLPAEILEPRRPADAAVIWLHGLGADGHDFVSAIPYLDLPADHGIRFVFPHAPSIPVTLNGGMVMPAWYDIGSLDLGGRADGEGLARSMDQVAALVAREKAAGIPASRIVLAGFSQGGAVAMQLAMRQTEPVAGLLALSTYLMLADEAAAAATPESRQTPVLQCHGLFDPMVLPAWGEAARDRLQALGYEVEWHAWPMQHEVCVEELQRIGSWLAERLPAPEVPA